MRVSVITPCRNEADFIDDFVASLASQVTDGFDIEFVIADGCSDDGTAERLANYAHSLNLKVISNPQLVTPSGLNKAIATSSGDIIVRMDVHTKYAPDYVRACVCELQARNAKCVGGPWVPVGALPAQRAIAAAFSSRFGSGSARSRQDAYNGPVDTVYLGAWWRHDLIAIGGFDDFFVRNQDDELALRIVRSGGTIWQSSSIRSEYAPRASLWNLWKQFFQYGYWKVPVIRKHRIPASPRHLAPFGFLCALAAGVALWPITIMGPIGSAALALAYLAASAAAATKAARRDRLSVLRIMGAFACMHFGYGIGFASGLLDFVALKRRPEPARVVLSR